MNPSAFDYNAWLAEMEAARVGRVEERLRPILEAIEKIGRPTTVPAEGGHVLRVAVDRDAETLGAIAEAVLQVSNGYFETLRKSGFAKTVYLKTVRNGFHTHLWGSSVKKYSR